MSGVTLSTLTSFVLADTRDSPGIITLPATQDLVGRMIIIKDQWGTFGTSSCTLQTSGSDVFAQGAQTKLLTTPYHSIQLIAGADQKWYILQDSFTTYMQVAKETANHVSTLLLTTTTLTAPHQARQQSIVFN